MTASEIAVTLGGSGSSGGWYRAQCPVHASHGRTLALRDGAGGLIVYCHAGCTPADVLAELRRLGLLIGVAGKNTRLDPATVERHLKAEARERQQRIANALDLWAECHSAPGTIVGRYWHSRRLAGPIPPIIRMHGMLRHGESGGRRPAMVALVEHVEHGKVGVHITYLAIDGSMQATVEPRKRSLGPVGGGAVRLGVARPDQWLVIGEGIETTASVVQATGLPGWAALSAGGIERLMLPPEARKVLIAADNDTNGTGEKAARDAGARWIGEGRQVRIAMPPEPGTDFNDMLSGESAARTMEADDAA